MRILFPIDVNKEIIGNPFVSVLVKELRRFGNEVICSRDDFWKCALKYDLIFFQWPEAVLSKKQVEDEDIEVIKTQLKAVKNVVPLVVTVHNFHPHNNNKFIKRVYDLIYEYVDAFHHMGDFSYCKMKQMYPNAYHFIIPHPIYFEGLKTIPVNICKKKFKLPLKKPVILAFGDFRSEGERRLFINLSHNLYFKCLMWAPKFNRYINIERTSFSKIVTRILYNLHGIKMFRGPISDDVAVEMARASDVIFIQREDILNSGNLPLGFSAGKIVVGPNVGNVGVILQNTGNPVFDPADFTSVIKAIEQALFMLRQNNRQGDFNYNYAHKNWTKEIIGQSLDTELNFILSNFIYKKNT